MGVPNADRAVHEVPTRGAGGLRDALGLEDQPPVRVEVVPHEEPAGSGLPRHHRKVEAVCTWPVSHGNYNSIESRINPTPLQLML